MNKNFNYIKYLFIVCIVLVMTVASFAQLTIDPGGLISIKQGSSMYIGTDFKINAINGGSGIFSDQTTNGDVTITGNVSVERYLVKEIWHNVASPVSSATTSVYDDSFSTYDLVFYYDETMVYNDWNFGWVLMNSGDALTPFKGYDVLDSADITVDYTGSGSAALNTGAYTIAVTNTSSTPTEIASHKGWNLVGNPYPSPVDWQASSGWTKTSINDAKYIWDGTNDQYTIWLGGGAPVGINGGTQYIPSNQGFWVQATSNGNFGISNAVRTGYITGTPDFYKSGEVFDYPLVSLIAEGDGHTDETIVRFIEGTTKKFDRNWDATKLFSMNPDVPQLYIENNGYDFALNTLPEIEENLYVPLDFKCAKAGYYTIRLTDRTNIGNHTELYLKDMLEHKIINLKQEGAYGFYHTSDNDNARFQLLFNPSQDVLNGITPDNYFSVYSNGNKIFIIKNTTRTLTGQVIVYNLQGQIISMQPISENKRSQLTINRATGYYIVRVQTSETVINTKVLIFNN